MKKKDKETEDIRYKDITEMLYYGVDLAWRMILVSLTIRFLSIFDDNVSVLILLSGLYWVIYPVLRDIRSYLKRQRLEQVLKE